MEWSEAVLNNVWEQIGNLCEIPDKNLYESLLNIQKNGYIKKDVNIADLSEILVDLSKYSVIQDYKLYAVF
jgi:hypothetical protein